MPSDTPPFSRRVMAADVPAGGREIRIEANEAERRALAKAFDLPEIGKLGGLFRLSPQGGDLHVEGVVEGRVSQVCVVSVETFETDIREEVALDFSSCAPDEASLSLDLSLDAPDPPDPLVDGAVDLGAVAAEFLALSLEPYPRKPGAGFVEHREQAVESPFARLGELLKKGGKGG